MKFIGTHFTKNGSSHPMGQCWKCKLQLFKLRFTA